MAFDGVTWSESTPDNSSLASQIDDYEKDLKIGIRSRMAIEHVFSSTSTATGDAGFHKYVSMQPQANAPTLSAGLTQVGALYIGTSAAGYPLMYEVSSGGTVTIVNSAGRLPLVTSGTQGSILICSSANPDAVVVLAGSTDGYVLTTHSSTAAPNWTAGVSWATLMASKSYDSGWFAISGDTSYAKTHSLGTTKCLIQILLSTASDGSTDCFQGYATYDRGHTEYAGYEGVDVVSLTTTVVTVRFCTSAYGYNQKVNSAGTAVQPAYARVIMLALE